MTTKATKRENGIKEFKEHFFESVKIESRIKGLHSMTNHAGHSERFCVDELFSQTKTRLILLRLTHKIMPVMNKTEYFDFIQNVIDNTSILENW